MKITARKLYEEGWKLETLVCPKCGGLGIYSKPHSKNGYSQFICIKPDCDFTDNKED